MSDKLQVGDLITWSCPPHRIPEFLGIVIEIKPNQIHYLRICKLIEESEFDMMKIGHCAPSNIKRVS